MPPKRTSSEQSFNIDLLEPEALVAPSGLQTALDSIQRICYGDDSSILDMIVALNCRPHILEYIFSGTLCIRGASMGLMEQIAFAALDDKAYERLSKWILSQFPPTTPNVTETLGINLLQRLSSSLMSVEGVSTTEHRNELREFRRKVGLCLNVLKELARCAEQAPVDANAPPAGRKKSKASARHVQLDPDPFDCMGIPVPVTEDGARALRVEILPQLQNILRVSLFLSIRPISKHLPGRAQHYLLVLRRPQVSDVFKRQLGDLGITTASRQSIIQPIKATLYFENVKGFGEWRILLSITAQKFLREARRSNGAVFKVILKKIQ